MKKFCRLDKLKILFVFSLLVFVLTGSFVVAVVPPCPVVSDVTIAQMAERWVKLFKDPYCEFLQERSDVLLREKLSGGVFSDASQINGIFRKLDEIPLPTAAEFDSEFIAENSRNNMGVKEIANAKIWRLKKLASAMAYNIAKDSYENSTQIESILRSFSPLAFDFASKYQVQKDAVKLASLAGLIQAQELKIMSLLKIISTLEGKN